MDYMPVDIPIEADEALFDAPPGASWTRLPKRHRPTQNVALRYRGLTFDLASGTVLLKDRQVRLEAAERELLRALMRKAGQIISVSRLADQLGVSVNEIEDYAHRLTTLLTEAGAPCRPRRVEGLGYILWR